MSKTRSDQRHHKAGASLTHNGCSKCNCPILIVEDQESIANMLASVIENRFPGKAKSPFKPGAEEMRPLLKLLTTGTGIPAENVHRLFKPLFTTKPVGKGTGFGLSISHGIVQKHRGALKLIAGKVKEQPSPSGCLSRHQPRCSPKNDSAAGPSLRVSRGAATGRKRCRIQLWPVTTSYRPLAHLDASGSLAENQPGRLIGQGLNRFAVMALRAQCSV